MSNPVIDKMLENLPGHWMQGGYADDEGNRCLAGHHDLAQLQVEGVETLGSSPAWNALLNLAWDEHKATPIDFNDLPSTSEEDIILLLKRANETFEEEAS